MWGYLSSTHVDFGILAFSAVVGFIPWFFAAFASWIFGHLYGCSFPAHLLLSLLAFLDEVQHLLLRHVCTYLHELLPGRRLDSSNWSFLAKPTTCGTVLFLFSFIELSGWSIGLRWRLKRKQLRGNTSSTTPLLALNCPNNEGRPGKLTVFPGKLIFPTTFFYDSLQAQSHVGFHQAQ